MRKIAIALIALMTLTAFAPAPFPKSGRRESGRDSISVQLFQGNWKVESFEIYQEGGAKQRSSLAQSIRVRDDRWSLMNGNSENASYSIEIKGANPAAIDFFSVGQNRAQGGKPFMFGLIRRDGDTIQILYNWGSINQPRPTSFQKPPAGWWLLTLQRMP